MGQGRRSKGIRRRAASGALSLIALLAFAAPTLADEDRMANYESSKAGHPVRVAAYIVHPIGVMLDNLIFKPAYWLGTHEPLKTLFGVTD